MTKRWKNRKLKFGLLGKLAAFKREKQNNVIVDENENHMMIISVISYLLSGFILSGIIREV